MSLILEALRKSEAERRRGNTPDVAMELPPTPLRTRNATPVWLWPALLAAIVVAALAWWLAGRGDAAQPATPVIDAAIVEPAPVAAAPAVVPRAPVAAPAVTAPAPVQTMATPEPAVVTPPVPASQQPPPTRELPPPPPPITQPPASVPSATSMSGVKLSMHMWDASADKRFVILNGQRMAEGDRNGEVQVIAIERDGVVVERDGQRARVPLP
jgi:general secretion pathway protein B